MEIGKSFVIAIDRVIDENKTVRGLVAKVDHLTNRVDVLETKVDDLVVKVDKLIVDVEILTGQFQVVHEGIMFLIEERKREKTLIDSIYHMREESIGLQVVVQTHINDKTVHRS